MEASDLKRMIGSIPSGSLALDSSRRLRVVPADQRPGLVSVKEIEAGLVGNLGRPGHCEQDVSGIQRVPVLLPIATVAPALDPVLWGKFGLVETFDPKIEKPAQPDGWIGTIGENVDLGVGGYLNVLNVEFAHGETWSRVDFSLERASKQSLAVDEGFLEVQPGEHYPYLVCRKTINFEPGAPICSLPRWVIDLELEIFLARFVVEYSLRLMLAEAEKNLSPVCEALWRDHGDRFLAELEAFGYVAATGTFSRWIEIFDRKAEGEHDVDTAGGLGDEGPPVEKQKIAVLGGGMGSLSAVYHLTSQPGWQKKYDVTVYQLGWRLGGKAASGRNRALHDRSEEDGIHVIFGYYANTIRLLEDLYQELGRDSAAPCATFDAAFEPVNLSVLQQQRRDGGWVGWPQTLSSRILVEDDSGEARLDSLTLAFEILRDLGARLHRLLPGASIFAPLSERLERILSRSSGQPPWWGLRLVAEPMHAALEAVLKAQELAASAFWMWHKEKILRDDRLAWAWISFNFAFANVRGLVADRILLRGASAVNDQDYAEWIARHAIEDGGLTKASAATRCLYATFFAYENGDFDRPDLEAGSALRALLRTTFCHRGTAYWKMRAGTGEAIFAPLYEVLKRRGVRFEFFSRVERLELSRGPGGRFVEAVVLRRQATVRGGRDYEPLVSVNALPCWPTEPLYEQLEEGEELQRLGTDIESWWSSRDGTREVRLAAGEDFDKVVLGIGLGALGAICAELVEDDDRWRAMVEKVKTVRTMALQLWLRSPLSELGWRPPESYPDATPVVGAYDVAPFKTPLNTWLQMDGILERESWPAGPDHPASLAYFCGRMPDDPDSTGEPWQEDLSPGMAREEARRYAERFLKLGIAHLWPAATDPPHDPRAPFDSDLQISRFVKANVNPSDRYVRTAVGSSKHRLKTDESGYPNLLLTGDWIDNGYNMGCLESAVMAGMLCSNAISGRPGLDEIAFLSFLDRYEKKA